MFRYTKNFLASVFGICFLFVQSLQISLAGEDRTPLVEDALQQYAQAYPDIYFLHLRARDMWAFYALPTLLGENASNHDYAHPDASRNLLVAAQLKRIRLMLGKGAPSATFFSTGRDAPVKQPYLCVLTLEDRALLEDPMAATSLMLAAEQQSSLQHVTRTAKLDSAAFLKFTLDHEVYHCLDAYLNGPPRPITPDELTAEYHDYLTEYGADMFAALYALHQGRDSRAFLEKIKSYRDFSLSDFDIAHMTADAIEVALAIPADKFSGLSLPELVQFASDHARRHYPSQEEYLRIYAAALQIVNASDALRTNMKLPGDLSSLPAARVQQVAAMTASLLEARRMIFGGMIK